MMRTTDRIVAPSRGANVAAMDYAKDRGAYRIADCHDYLMSVYHLCQPDDMPDASIVVAQSVHETTHDGAPWNSFWWRARLNPAGIGVTGDPKQNLQSPTFATGEEAARAQVSHLLVYALGPADAGSLWFRRTGRSIADDDPRYDAYVEAYGNVAMAETIAGLAGTWAADERYDTKIVARGNAVYPDLPDQEGPPVPTFSTVVPGLPGGPLVTEYPIRLNLMAVDGYQRTGRKANTPRRSVQHGTGNPNNPSAWAEAQYFVNGAEGRQASIHYCTDDREAVVVVPLDEVTWQAADGAGPGNLNGFSCEMMEATAIWTNPSRRDALIALTADLMGRTAARLGASKPEQHWTFNAGSEDRHDCPNKLRHTTVAGQSAWDIYARIWQAARIDELRRMGGDTTTTTTTAAPKPPAHPSKRIPAPDTMRAQGYDLAWNKPNRFYCLQGGVFKTAPDRDAPDASKAPYKANRRYTFDFSAVVAGESWLVSKAGSWAPARNFKI